MLSVAEEEHAEEGRQSIKYLGPSPCESFKNIIDIVNWTWKQWELLEVLQNRRNMIYPTGSGQEMI